jgi:hypothetical protein
MVPKQPPPSFFAPNPAINPLKMLFMEIYFENYYQVIHCHFRMLRTNGP